MNETTFHAGHVAVLGRPNVGKSTLINALVGTKVSIVSPRPQTTRHRLLGIATFPEGQLLLVDTPGIHRDHGNASASAMHKMMNRAARGAPEGVDAAMLVVRAGQWSEEDTLAYDALKGADVPVVLVVNQVDRYPDKAALLPYLQSATEGREFASVHPVSALKRKGLEPLVKTVLAREQLMRQLGAELPYATTVEIESFVVDGRMLRIGAVIFVERESQKAIVIGKGGSRLREIGSKARIQMERMFDSKVFLETWVRVREGWSDDEAALKAFGYSE
jgi:GTPase